MSRRRGGLGFYLSLFWCGWQEPWVDVRVVLGVAERMDKMELICGLHDRRRRLETIIVVSKGRASRVLYETVWYCVRRMSTETLRDLVGYLNQIK